METADFLDNKQRLKWTFAKYEQKNKETEKETKNGQEGTRNQETQKQKTKKQRGKEAKKQRSTETKKH